MELKESMYALSERIASLKDQIKTEEATKQSFILPFFQYLGFDVFNPLEFVPEFIADVGIKKGEKVDYAIIIDNKPFIVVEAKGCFEKLEKHDSQLFRYFGTTEAKFAILTNGIIYKFYTDLDTPNKMDSVPFYELNLLDLNDQALLYLENFQKNNLDINNILSTAEELKYLNLIKAYFKDKIENPDDNFVRYILNGVYEGMKTQSIIDKFRPLIKKSINQYINDKMSARFKETLINSDEESNNENEESNNDEPISKIVTTIDELNAFAIVKAILRPYVPASRIFYKDTESYFGILLDNNTRKWICRIKLGTKTQYLIIAGENKKEEWNTIENLDSIFDYSNNLIDSLNRYLNK